MQQGLRRQGIEAKNCEPERLYEVQPTALVVQSLAWGVKIPQYPFLLSTRTLYGLHVVVSGNASKAEAC